MSPVAEACILEKQKIIEHLSEVIRAYRHENVRFQEFMSRIEELEEQVAELESQLTGVQ